jgi:hypothetical protein
MSDDEKTNNTMTLYVEQIDTEIVPSHHNKTTAVDIELSQETAELLIIYLQHRFRKPSIGGIRVRLSGRLVLS